VLAADALFVLDDQVPSFLFSDSVLDGGCAISGCGSERLFSEPIGSGATLSRARRLEHTVGLHGRPTRLLRALRYHAHAPANNMLHADLATQHMRLCRPARTTEAAIVRGSQCVGQHPGR
jgi:hypothetical protein